jgi:lambda family phage portal protein
MKARRKYVPLDHSANPGALADSFSLKPTAGAFTAGDRQSRELASWRPKLQSADADMLDNKEVAEARTIDLVRNNGIASGAVQSRKDRVVGAKFRLILAPDYRTLGLDRAMLREWARLIEGEYSAWADDPSCFADAQRKRTVTEILRDSEATRFMQGESFLTREWRFMPFNESPYGTCFAMVEPERVSNPMLADAEKIRAGIEFDSYGAATAFHIRTRHPEDFSRSTLGGDIDPNQWQRITKYNRFGWLQVIHNFEQQRSSQTRGFSSFASVVKRLKMLDRQENIQLELSIIAASLAIVIESQFGPNSAHEALGASGIGQLAEYVGAQSSFKKNSPVLFDGVKIPHLFPGEKLNVSRAEPPGDQFAAFQEAMLRHTARGLNTSYESLSGDYSKTSYSSARAAMAESWASVLASREFGPARNATHIFRLWLREGIVRGLLPLPPGVKLEDFLGRMGLFSRCGWLGAGRIPIDELKNARANKLQLETNQTTLASIAADAGMDWEEMLEQRAEEMNMAKELGVDPVINAANAAANSDGEMDNPDNGETQGDSQTS